MKTIRRKQLLKTGILNGRVSTLLKRAPRFRGIASSARRGVPVEYSYEDVFDMVLGDRLFALGVPYRTIEAVLERRPAWRASTRPAADFFTVESSPDGPGLLGPVFICGAPI